MALDVSHLSKLQRELYKEKYGFDKLSRNFQSAPIHDPSRWGRITTFPDRYSRHLDQADIQVKCPWGRARSYAGEAPVCLPADHRPKWEPPDLLQKGHRHYGSGASPHPRGVPLQQFYNLTHLKKSKVRWNDELMPRPTTANVQEGQIILPFPKESPMSSHMSRQAMFPKPEQNLSPIPPPVILNKAMGSFGRREIITPMVNSRTVTPPKYQVKPVQEKNCGGGARAPPAPPAPPLATALALSFCHACESHGSGLGNIRGSIHSVFYHKNKMAAIVLSEASWRRRWKPELKSQPWKPFNVSDKEYLLKSMFVETDCSYELCIWDFTKLWYEKVEQESFNARAKKINPNVEAKLSYLVKFVQESIEEDKPSGKATFTMIEDGADKCILKMKTKLKAGVPFLWEFHFSLGQQDMVGSQLVKPLLAMITEMTRRQAELCTLLHKKDQEIKDYKESGARLTTKSHGTSEFDENAFQNKMVLSQGFEESVKNCGTKCFNESACELYKQVMIKTAWLAEKDLPEPDEGDFYESIPHGVAGVPSAQSSTDLHPPSLLSAEPMDSSPSRVSPRKTPVTSPVKSRMSSPVGSPSKDMELQRREALQKKLEEKAERNKRKRPKINL